MIYTESQQFNRRGILLLVLVALGIYVLPMALLPVRGIEARMAFLANREARTDDAGSQTGVFQGQSPYALATRGLYAIAALGRPTGDKAESSVTGSAGRRGLPALSPHKALWSVRLPVLLGLAFLILPAAHVIATEIGKVEAYFVAGMALTCWPLALVANLDRRLVVLAGLLNAAWFMWYHYARNHGNWDMAWAAAAAFMLLACLEGGTLLLAVFYTPLIFLRRPFRIWQRMLNPVHLFALAAILIISIFWAHVSHADQALEAIRRGYGDDNGLSLSLMTRIVLFPAVFGLLFMPWPALTWPAYCAAYRPLERSSAFCHFLRALAAPLFIIAWAMPGFPQLLMVSVVPALACLATVHYQLLVRRYIVPLRRFSIWFRRVTAVPLLMLMGTIIVHTTGILEFDGLKARTLAMMSTVGALGLMFLLFARWRSLVSHFWVEVVLDTAGAVCVVLAVTLGAIDVLRRDVELEAATLTAAVPEDTPVFVMQGGRVWTTAFHSRRRLVPVAEASNLPETEKVVYVWGGAKPPILETRTWDRVSEPLPMRRPNRISMRQKQAGRPGWILSAVRDADPPAEDVMRMYRGTLNPEAERLLGAGR